MLFFISNTFISNVRLKLAKTLAKAKQYLDAEPRYLKIICFLHLLGLDIDTNILFEKIEIKKLKLKFFSV